MKRPFLVATLLGVLSTTLVSCASNSEQAQVQVTSPSSPYYGVYGPGEMMDEMVRDLTPNHLANPSVGLAMGRL